MIYVMELARRATKRRAWGINNNGRAVGPVQVENNSCRLKRRKTSRTRFSITSARSKTSVTIFLVNGVKLQGFVTWFDNFCVLLRRDGHSQLVYKHAISTIMPASPITMFEAVEEGSDAH